MELSDGGRYEITNLVGYLFAVIGTTAAFADRADAIERLGNKLSTGLLWGVVFFVGLMLWGWLRK